MPTINTLILVVLLAAAISPSASAEDPEDLSSKLQKAYQLDAAGQVQDAKAVYDEVIKSNPAWHVYERYVSSLVGRGAFDEAVEVLLSAKNRNPPLADIAPERIDGYIQTIRKKRDVAFAMQSISPWDEPAVSTYGDFSIKSQIPAPHIQEVKSVITEIFTIEKKALAAIFDAAKPASRPLTVFAIGRFDDFRRAIDNRSTGKKSVYERVYYNEKAGELVLFYDGTSDWLKAAVGIAHYLLHESYAQNPSLFFKSGLSQYLAYQFPAPEAAALREMHRSFLAQSYRNGAWLTIAGILDAGSRVESALRSSGPSLPSADLRQIFDAGSLLFFEYMLEVAPETERGIFLAYLNQEREQSFNFCTSAIKYFEENFSKSQMNAINQGFIASLIPSEPVSAA